MPIYQYACKCGVELELLMPIALANKRVKCGCSKFMKKVLSPTRGIVKNPAVPRRSKR